MNQYMNSEAELVLGSGLGVRLKLSTRYPWDGRIELELNPAASAEFSIRLRVPEWCSGYRVEAGGAGPEALTDQGYLVLDRKWYPGDKVVLELDMPVNKVRARTEVEADRGRVAVQRGPVVYCLEQTDHPGLSYDGYSIPSGAKFRVEHLPELLGGVTVLLSRDEDGRPLRFIPYYAWDNREPGFMQVWVRELEGSSLYSY